MASSASNSEPSGKGFVEREQTPAPARGDSAPRKLLQEVLQKTASSMNPSDGEPADPEVLREVARRHRDRPFELEPVLIELVHASLKSQNPLFGAADSDWHLSRQLAESLFEDPAAHERMKLLWERLRASS